MLNCLANSIFHILFCIALAKVLKHVVRNPGNSICHLCLPRSHFHYHFLPSPLNSPWTDFPCLEILILLWSVRHSNPLPLHCVWFFLTEHPHISPPLMQKILNLKPFIIITMFNAENYLITNLYTWFYVLGFTDLQRKNPTTLMRLRFDAFLIGLPQRTCVTAHCFVLFHQSLSRYHKRCNKWSLFFPFKIALNIIWKGTWANWLTPTPLRVAAAARDSHMRLAECMQMPKIKSVLDTRLFVYMFTVMCW